MHKKALNLPISVASQLEIAPRSCVAHTTAEVLCIPSTPWHNEACTQFCFVQLQNDDERPFGIMKFHKITCTVHICWTLQKKLGKTVNITMKWWSRTRPKPVYNMPMPDSTSSISWKSKMWLSKHHSVQNHWFFRFLRWINMSLIGMWNLEKPKFTVKNTPYQWNRRFFFSNLPSRWDRIQKTTSLEPPTVATEPPMGGCATVQPLLDSLLMLFFALQ